MGNRVPAVRWSGRIRWLAGLMAVVLVTLMVSSGVVLAYRGGTTPPRSAAVPTRRVTLAIGGMDCKGCESGIAGELTRTPGVVAAVVSYERREAVVDYDPSKISTAGIIAAIKGAGFTAKVKRA